MGISKTAGTKQYTEKDELWYARQSGNILQSFIEFSKLSILPRRPSELNAKKIYLYFYLLPQCS